MTHCFRRQLFVQGLASQKGLAFASAGWLFTTARTFAPQRRLQTRIGRLLPWSRWAMRAENL